MRVRRSISLESMRAAFCSAAGRVLGATIAAVLRSPAWTASATDSAAANLNGMVNIVEDLFCQEGSRRSARSGRRWDRFSTLTFEHAGAPLAFESNGQRGAILHGMGGAENLPYQNRRRLLRVAPGEVPDVLFA